MTADLPSRAIKGTVRRSRWWDVFPAPEGKRRGLRRLGRDRRYHSCAKYKHGDVLHYSLDGHRLFDFRRRHP